MPDDDRLSEQEAASKLGLTLNELRDFRTVGRIRAHASYGNWSFAAGDVAALQRELEAEATQKSAGTDPQSGQPGTGPSDRTPPAGTRSYTPSKYEPGGDAASHSSRYQSASRDTPGSDTPGYSRPRAGMSSQSAGRITAEETARRLGIRVDEVMNLRLRGRLRGYSDYGNWVYEEADVARLADEMPSATPASSESIASESGTVAEPPTIPESGPAPTDSPPFAIAESSGSGETTVPARTPEPVSPSVPTASPAAGSPAAALSLDELVLSDQPIDSARIIEALAARHQVGFVQAAKVVDGFWDHLLNTQHYGPGRRKLQLPHFGVFRLKRNRQGETELHFTSRPLNELRMRRESSGRQSPDTAWIEHWLRHPTRPGRLQGLTLKRRLAVIIAGDTGLDLRTTFLILWDLVDTITGIMISDRTDIRWARRGVMQGNSPSGSSHYEFRTYKRLRDRLPPLAAQPRRKTTSETGCLSVILSITFLAGMIGIACRHL